MAKDQVGTECGRQSRRGEGHRGPGDFRPTMGEAGELMAPVPKHVRQGSLWKVVLWPSKSDIARVGQVDIDIAPKPIGK